MSVTIRLSAEDYLSRDFPPRTQLIGGEVVVNDPVLRHQRITVYVIRRLADWVDGAPARGEAGIGSDWVVTDRDVFVPDVWWLREDRRPVRDAARVIGVPDLAVEVRSPSTWRYDLGPKRAAYEQAGTVELWLVDAESQTVIVNRRSSPEADHFDVLLELGGGDTLASPLFPGLGIEIDEVFDR